MADYFAFCFKDFVLECLFLVGGDIMDITKVFLSGVQERFEEFVVFDVDKHKVLAQGKLKGVLILLPHKNKWHAFFVHSWSVGNNFTELLIFLRLDGFQRLGGFNILRMFCHIVYL